MYTACIKQLRRILRAPAHISKINNLALLHQYQLDNPPLLLRDLCHKVAARDSDRRRDLHDTDILLRIPPPDYARYCQVLEEVYTAEIRRCQQLEVHAPEAQHICQHCLLPFPTLTRLRAHQFVEHDDRSGALRLFQPTDTLSGLPTCQRCNRLFSTYSGLEYHIMYVCPHPQQDLEDVEHRLRVQELIQFARSRQIQALAANQELLSYFHHRCALCSMFCTTPKGLQIHWQRYHHAEFLRHDAVNNELLQHWPSQTPCVLCGTAFKQYHRCHIIRQLALLLVQDGSVATHIADHLECQECGKVYTTHHGLQQYMRRYHRATQDSSMMDELSIDLHCLVAQAVEQDRAEDLLQHEDIRFFMTTRCIPCGKSFPQKRSLTRHFHLNHASEWHECISRAVALDAQWKPQYGCVCHPVQHLKHVCTMYIQYVLLRLEHERQLQPQIAPLPPDLVLSAAEQIEPLLWLGCAHLLYDKVELRIVLTKVCQICGQNCRDGTALQQHLNDAHPHHMEDVRMFKEMFQWSLFQEQGCFCNPSPGWGEPNHECVGLTQLAWIAQSFNWQVVLPWAFKSNELVTELSDALPLQALQRVTLALMARNFHKLWQDTDLEVMLKTRCLLCQEYLSLGYIKSHLSVQHQVTLDKVKYVMPQVAAVFADMNSEVWHCEWCAGLLPTWSTNEEFVPDHLRHMMECPYVMQIALLLMMPKWHSPALQPLTWASQDHIASVRRQHQLQQWQLHAGISDTFGMSMEALAQYGLQFMQDPLIAEQVSFRCLLCTKCFFMSTKFEQHLHTDHNFQQMQTLMCYHRLALHCGSSCQFCGKTHSTDQCIPLLNLAVYLVNGYGIRGAHRPRLSGTDVGSTTQQGTDATTGPDQTQRKNQRQEAAQDWRQSPRSTLTFFFNNGGADRAPSTTGASVTASRRQHQLPDAGIPVHGPHEPWQGVNSPPPAPGQPNVACHHRQNSHPAAPPSPGHDADVGDAVEDLVRGNSHGGTVRRLHELPSHMQRHRPNDAVSEVVSTEAEASTNRGSWTTQPGGAENTSQRAEDLIGPPGDTPVPRPQEAEGGGRAEGGHSVALDSVDADSTRALVRASTPLLPQYLAAHPSEVSATNSRSATFSQAIAEGNVNLVPIFENHSGTICFANTVILCLAWLTILADGYHPQQWTTGYEMLRRVFQAEHRPVDLMSTEPFLWLLLGSWTVETLQRQQDVCEFAIYLLSLLQPKFLHCEWVTKVSLTAEPANDVLASEKGHQFMPILIPYINFQDDFSQLQELVHLWHDSQSFCRGTTQVGKQLILMIDRYDPESLLKCQQHIDFGNTISFPCFVDAEGNIRMDLFAISGVIFHLGQSPRSGHYRAALRYQQGWLIYDDNKIPDRVDSLPMEVHRNCTMFWLVRPTAHTVRTMEQEDPRLVANRRAPGGTQRCWRRRNMGPYQSSGSGTMDAP